jgi:AcrR family transcriptional regulator
MVKAQLADDYGLDGVRPVKQMRGRRSRDRLLNAGQKLVASRPFDALSVADIARAAGCSVGAFYLRFRDKDTFLRALIAQYVAEVRAETDALFATHTDDRLIAALVSDTIDRFRRYAGLIRSAIRKRMEDATVWEPIRRSGHLNADRFVAWLAQRRGAALAPAEDMSVRFAFQVLYGTLNNALANQPGPLDIADPAFAPHLERAFRLVLLSTGAPPALASDPPGRPRNTPLTEGAARIPSPRLRGEG